MRYLILGEYKKNRYLIAIKLCVRRDYTVSMKDEYKMRENSKNKPQI